MVEAPFFLWYDVKGACRAIACAARQARKVRAPQDRALGNPQERRLWQSATEIKPPQGNLR